MWYSSYAMIHNIQRIKSFFNLSLIGLFFIVISTASQLFANQLNVNEVALAKKLIIQTDSLFRKNCFNEAIEISNHAIAACEVVGDLDGIAVVLNIVGNIYRIQGEYGKALNNFYISLEHFQNLENTKGTASTLNYIGSVYRQQGNYPGALKFLLNSLKLYQQLDDKSGLAQLFNNIGIVYFYQKNYSKALEFYNKSLEIELALKSELGVGISYINIGEIHHHRGEYQKALDYYLKALVISKKHDEVDGIGILYKEIGVIYTHLGNLYLAKTYLHMALDIFNNLKDVYRIAECQISIGKLSIKEGNFNRAVSSFQNALQLAETSNSLELIAESNKYLSDLFNTQNNTEKSLKHFKKYITARDSLFNEEKTKKTVQAEMLFEFERQMTESNLQQARKDAIANERADREALLRRFLLTIIVSFIIVIFLIFSAYKSKKKTNELLAYKQNEILEKNEELLQQQEEILAQRDEIEKKNRILEETHKVLEAKNERIISSIEYAQTIQQAILPNEDDFKRFFPDHMVFFRPKDIVSGDFYWFSSLGDLTFVAVIDCTGHGVPGSFMSLIGNIILNQVVNEWQTRDPEYILQLVHNQVRRALKQDQAHEKSHASMDICLVTIDTAKRRGIFTGARRPLYMFKNGTFKKFSGDPYPVGGFQFEKQRRFTKHTLDFSETTWLYLTTDGFIDQMNIYTNKFGTKRLVELLNDIHQLPMELQKNALQNAFYNHKGNHDQIDDVCVLGLKI